MKDVWLKEAGLRDTRAGIAAEEGMEDIRHREARRGGGAF